MHDMVINYDSDIFNCTHNALIKSELNKLVDRSMDILIKPNMVMAKPPSMGATTHREVVEAIIVYLKEAGVQRIKIAESAWIGGDTKKAYKVCGYDSLKEKYGVSLLDLKDDKIKTVSIGGISMEICKEALDTHFLINVPVLKAHCQTSLTCNLKNLKGVISDKEKRHFHTLGLHKPIALLNKAVKTSFCVVDGICGDLTFEEGGNPVERNMVITGCDPLLIDSYCANLIGYDASEIGYITYAKELGLGRIYDGSADILELNAFNKPLNRPAVSGIVKSLEKNVEEKEACSACYCALMFALNKNRRSFNDKIKIGQGYKGVSGEGIGVGNCTGGFSHSIKGCPPKANDIAAFLNSIAK